MSDFSFGGQIIKAGQRKRVMIDTASLYDFTTTAIAVEVIRGKEDGPVLFISSGIHGDEINGINIIRRLLHNKNIRKIKGTIIAVPIVNVFGFNTKSRYMPDRRDLNRSFPGSERGSMASQMADTFMQEIVAKSTHGIDLHTAAIHRNNLPQIRGCFDEPLTKELAEAFGVPVMIDSALPDGSLREAAREHKIPILLFEGGEALRFSETVTRIAVKGILNVMKTIGMLPTQSKVKHTTESFHAKDSHWLRAPHSGILQSKIKLGARIMKDQLIGKVSDPFGTHTFEIRAKFSGIVIGMSMIPLLSKGDPVVHIATFEDSVLVKDNLDQYQEDMLSESDTFII